MNREEDKEGKIPENLTVNDSVTLLKAEPEQHFTKPLPIIRKARLSRN